MRAVYLPDSLDELWECCDRIPGASVYAGGTDLLVKMRTGLLNPLELICLERIADLKGVSEHEQGIRIGSCTTHSSLLVEPLIRRDLPVFQQALAVLGSPLIRNMGTIGGNICTASPAGDTLPPLYVLDAEVELQSKEASRQMPLRDFITGPGSTCLRKGEILAAIWVKKPENYTIHHFEKVGQRNALACSVVSVAALLRLSPDGVVEKAALAWGSVAPTIVMCREVEESLEGERLCLEKLREAAAIIRSAVSPISDVRADAEYRRTVSGNLLLRLIQAGSDSDRLLSSSAEKMACKRTGKVGGPWDSSVRDPGKNADHQAEGIIQSS